MKRFSFFRPVVFKNDNTFVTHDLAKNWLKRLNVTEAGKNYSLEGLAPSGGIYKAYFDQDGHFLTLKMSLWSRASVMMLCWSEFRISRITRYIDQTGAVWTSFRYYTVTERVGKSNISSKARERVIAELQRQGVSLPEEFNISLTEKIYTSYLSEGKKASVRRLYVNQTSTVLMLGKGVREVCEDGGHWVTQESQLCGFLAKMPPEHIAHWLH